MWKVGDRGGQSRFFGESSPVNLIAKRLRCYLESVHWTTVCCPARAATMIITEPNDFVAEVHDRMPVLLTEKDLNRG